jgi:cysteate synthase
MKAGMNTEKFHYTLKCAVCGKVRDDAFDGGFILDCGETHGPGLLRSEFGESRLNVLAERPGLFRYSGWLPVRRTFGSAPAVRVFQAEKLGRRLGLNDLWVAFSGYWPEKDAGFSTGTFKELEANAVCSRIPEGETAVMVLSSAGNTARAFLKTCSEESIPAVIVIPESGLAMLRSAGERNPLVKVVAVRGGADYLDAIRLGNRIAGFPGFYPEGGVKNVGRRDGMGTVLLAAAERTGRLPAHYFQAVGSGTGAIAVWEMHRRLLADGRYGNGSMTVHLSQNVPFTPMTDAWNGQSRTLPADVDKTAIGKIRASVLSNRQPPYAIAGGVFDVLTASGGRMDAVSNAEAERAGALFLAGEGCDLDPAAEVALASVIRQAGAGTVGKDEMILLNVTGGGYSFIERDLRPAPVEPDVTVTAADADDPESAARLVDRLR